MSNFKTPFAHADGYKLSGLYTQGTGELLRYYADVLCSSSCNSLPRYGATVVADEDMVFH